MESKIRNFSWDVCHVAKNDTQNTTATTSSSSNSTNNKTNTSINSKSPQVKKSGYEYKNQKFRTDKRVSLNVAPIQFDKSGNFNPIQEPFASRIAYVLGSKRKLLPTGQSVYGFLNSCLSNSCGLIFPYTPQINITHSVNYDSSSVTHSNLQLNHYKNTPPPSYRLEAVFTADNRENALHMLSAIWFLRAVTKCDFGEEANTRGVAGMPPPVLYLNGYNQIMDNIPVIVKSFSYTLPNDKDYVSLGINLDTNNFIFNDRLVESDSNGNFFDNGNTPSEDEGMKYINGLATALDSLKTGQTILPSNRFNSCYFNNWLPTEMSFSIDLEVQPNILKTKKTFSLDDYKAGIYNLDNHKGGTKVYIPTENGTDECTNLLSFEVFEAVGTKTDQAVLNEKISWAVANNDYRPLTGNQTAISFSEPKEQTQTMMPTEPDKIMPEVDRTMYDWVKYTLSKESTEKVKSGLGLTDITTKKTYNFDRSGFTW